MHTVIGIDAATQARNVGLARSLVAGSHLEVEEALTPASNAEAVETVARWCAGPTLLALSLIHI